MERPIGVNFALNLFVFSMGIYVTMDVYNFISVTDSLLFQVFFIMLNIAAYSITIYFYRIVMRTEEIERGGRSYDMLFVVFLVLMVLISVIYGSSISLSEYYDSDYKFLFYLSILLYLGVRLKFSSRKDEESEEVDPKLS